MAGRDQTSAVDSLDQLKHDIREGIRTRIPGFVVSPGTVPGTYNVQPGRRGKLRTGAKFDLAICLDTPVLWPRFAGMIFKGRLEPGDEVDLVVYDREIDAYRLTGGLVDPAESRMHSLTDVAIDLGGLSSLKRPILGPALAGSEAELWIGKEDGTAALRIQIDGPLITIGSVEATEFIMLGTTLGAAAQAVSVATTARGIAAGPDAAVINGLKANLIALADAIAQAPSTQVRAS